MGSTFRYIADEALEASDLGACQHCRREGVPSYDYHGEIVNPLLAANPARVRMNREVAAACAECIHGGNLRKSWLYWIQPIIDAFAKDKLQAIEEYHRIPDIPLMMQGGDWAMCCGDWCEFQGNPKDYLEAATVPALSTFWDHGLGKWRSDEECQPEELREVCIFRCLSCKKSYFIWQPT